MPREPIMLHQLLITNVEINVKKYLEWLSLTLVLLNLQPSKKVAIERTGAE